MAAIRQEGGGYQLQQTTCPPAPESFNQPLVLEYPPPLQKHPNQKESIRCESVSPAQATVIELDQNQQMVLDCSKPIQMEWPPQPQPTHEYAPSPSIEDSLKKIPDQIVPQNVTVIKPAGDAIRTIHLNHPLCPDAQLHVQLDPSKLQKPTPVLKIPSVKCPVRGPQRPWRQCVESQDISDQVRRPLARTCFRREAPPLMLAQSEFYRIQSKLSERERKKEECEAAIREKECQRLRSRCRHSQWNYTVESLLEKKRKEEMAKQQKEKEDTEQLLAEMKTDDERKSQEQIAKANKLMLYRKGLIRDFHAAMAYSKMMQDIEKAKTKGKEGENDPNDKPFWNDKCMKKMQQQDNLADYSKPEKKERPPTQKLIKICGDIARRKKEHEQELNCSLQQFQKFVNDGKPELPENYKKYIAEKECDDSEKRREQKRRQAEHFNEVADALASDAYIESYEKEIERQAEEFDNYKRKVDSIRKAKEKQLIADKVAYNLAKSEKAAQALLKMQKKQEEIAGDYNILKEQWHQEWLDRNEERKACRDKKLEKTLEDFCKRKGMEEAKKMQFDCAREWARERLMEMENYTQECDRKNERRQKAEQINLYNAAQAMEKKSRLQKSKQMDDVWSWKMKREYEEEMCQMKNYAEECIKDWEEKGRSSLPMRMAMKKWDYDAGMYPFPEIKRPPKTDGAAGDNCRNGVKNNKKFETTSTRLGFYEGGT